ncbi:MAG: hypothetical protein IJ435_08040 [Clostridia bacterium]|nr:hypothetical protein [Clostridia bacterium]
MKKKYVSPLFAELELELEDVLFDSELDNDGNDEWTDDDFDKPEDDFGF